MDAGSADLSDITTAVEQVFEEHIYRIEQFIEPAPIELGDRWEGGTLVMQPADSPCNQGSSHGDLLPQNRDGRDRLRVMEQQINAEDKLTDEDKVNLQQYITRIYGGLTTFNVLFKYKEDQFKGRPKAQKDEHLVVVVALEQMDAPRHSQSPDLSRLSGIQKAIVGWKMYVTYRHLDELAKRKGSPLKGRTCPIEHEGQLFSSNHICQMAPHSRTWDHVCLCLHRRVPPRAITRAGAMAGYGLLWAILAANAAKYPFFEFGSRYASATGTSLIEGFRSIGRRASWLYLLLTLGTCFFVTAAVGMVTGAFLDNLLGVSVRMEQPLTGEVTVGLFVACVALLMWGKFNALDKVIKLLAGILLVSTVTAVALTVLSPPPVTAAPEPWDWRTPSGIAFVVALMGWMPSAVDLSTWNSFWTLERIRTTGYRPTLRETLAEFNWGYGISVVLALCFVTLGTMLLHRSQATLPDGSAAFASGIVDLYASAMGTWSRPIMGAAAFSAMFSTCITVLDGYARSLDRAWAAATSTPEANVFNGRPCCS